MADFSNFEKNNVMKRDYSLAETFFEEIKFENFIDSISDDSSFNSLDYNKQYYQARYDNFFQLINFSDSELKELFNAAKNKFIEDNEYFDEEVFRNSYSFGINKFIDELKDYLSTLRRGKAYNIERCGNNFIHHFELSLDVTSGKTIIVSTKNIDQIFLYFKTIKKELENTITEKYERESNLEIQDKSYQRVVKEIKNTFHTIDTKKGWEYCFKSEEDFNQYITILANFFNLGKIASSEKIQIQVKKNTKTKTAKVLREIYNNNTEETLKYNDDFFNIVKILSTFHELSLEEIYTSLGR